MSSTTKTTIHDDCWMQIMVYSDEQDLCLLSRVSKQTSYLTEKSGCWSNMCKILWKDKQNHPLERWVKLDKFKIGHGSSKNIATTAYNGRGICPNTLSFVEKSIFELQVSRNVLNEEMELINQALANNETQNGLQLLTRHERLMECKLVLENRISMQLKQKHKLLRDAAAGCAVLPEQCPTDSPPVSSRVACPLSVAVRARWMLVEHEYFAALDEAAEIERDLAQLLTHETASFSAARAAKVNCLDDCDSDSGTGACLQVELTMRLRELNVRANALQQDILSNMSSAVDVTAEERLAAQEDSLLSWKESYRASLVDSKRLVFTAEELREQGDLVILFGNVLESMRFVRGGLCFFDNRCFIQRQGWFEILGDQFFVPQVGCSGQVVRCAKDWGWEFVCQQGFVRMATFDRRKGFASHEGALSRNQSGKKWAPTEVVGDLVRSNPVYGLYRQN